MCKALEKASQLIQRTRVQVLQRKNFSESFWFPLPAAVLVLLHIKQLSFGFQGLK